MATFHTLGQPAALPLALLSQAIHRLSRAELEDLAQSLIDHMDANDGDPDFEDDDHNENDDPCEEESFLHPSYAIDQTRPLYDPLSPGFKLASDLLSART